MSLEWLWRVCPENLASQNALITSVDISTAFSLGEWSETSGGTNDGAADRYRGLAEEPNGSEAGGDSGWSVSTNRTGNRTLSPAHAEALTRVSICINVEIRWGYFGNSVRPLSSRIILECSRDEREQVTITLNLSFYIYLVARKTVWLPRVVGSVQIMHREVVRKQSRLYGMQGAFTMY